ncbi:DUF6292 family protein [Streptomyces sp. 769]|uniref:DUF6292 family protein n=1 Tax=Streptomyces sp. 769 TaxID=1262452 RepID=UPI000582124B|nr:DUF6292 family protein [Streptomyces sp. 769]AJC62114.1 hypothetical protein GZL_p00184 [Streptomyces sp. 769]
MTNLPHDSYMAAVADALTARGIAPGRWWTSEDDSGASSDLLNAIFQWPEGVAHPEHWPHGVYLTWDQDDGWRLIESDGSRNIDDLSPDSRVGCDPRQVAADVQARLTHGLGGWTPARSASTEPDGPPRPPRPPSSAGPHPQPDLVGVRERSP